MISDCWPGDRAVSDLVGYILVFSLIFVTVGAISLGALPTLDSARESEQLQNAERAFDVLNSNMIEVYERGAPSRATEINADDGTVETREAVTFNITLVDSAGNTTSSVTETNPVVFTGLGNTEFVFEAGAVIRDQRDQSVMLREPPFSVGDKRVLFTLVKTVSDSRQAVGGGTVLVRAVSTSRSVEIADTDTSVSEYDQFNVTVAGSPRQDAWQRYFENELGLNCTAGTELDCGLDLTQTNVRQTFVTIQGIRINLEL